jgi:hypothetical protein
MLHSDNNSNDNSNSNATRQFKMSGKEAAPTILQVKINLSGSKPPIWRTVLCKSDTTLETFHRVIQDAMGWDNSHLHMFKVQGQSVGPLALECSNMEDERETTLEDVAPKKRFEYEYDFGDCWRHDIHVEKEVPYDPNVSYPCCIKGKRACPPEDCGGIWGYHAMLNELAAGTLDKWRREWLEEYTGGKPWNAEEFDLEKVNEALHAQKPPGYWS